MATKAKKEWQSETIAEWEQSKNVVWRAQTSESPDGKEFIGVRKYARKADGTETPDRAGITLLKDDSNAEVLSELISLFEALQNVSKKSSGKKTKPALKKIIEDEPLDKDDIDDGDTIFFFTNDAGKYLVRIDADHGVKMTVDKEKAKSFSSFKDAAAFRKKATAQISSFSERWFVKGEDEDQS